MVIKMKNVLEYLEKAENSYPDKIIFGDETTEITYRDFIQDAKSVGTALLKQGIQKSPVAVLLGKNTQSLVALMGVLYSGCFYTVLDAEMPSARIGSILEDLSPAAVLTDKTHKEKLHGVTYSGPVMLIEELLYVQPDNEALKLARAKSIDTDPAYVLFTSGSTGKPKGTVVCHRSIIAYAEWVGETFGLSENTVFGNQTPFYFSMSVLDIYSTLRNAATMQIIPQRLFTFPIKLIEYLRTRSVDTLYWVPSALAVLSNWKAFEYSPAPPVKTVLFAGEVMPAKVLNYWSSHLPQTLFANLYGPTEVTDICTYYVVNRPFADTESIPIGKACNNCDVLVITPEGREAVPDEEGELYVRGSFLAMGYYNNPKRTAEVFVQNPLNPHYPETVYRTGDIVKRNNLGELLYITRKDFQIKHMGYRIELGEIEAAAYACDEVDSCAAIYDDQNDRIILYYQSHTGAIKSLSEQLQGRLPKYMLPAKLIPLEGMLFNQNGKIDRVALKAKYEAEK